MGGTAMEEALTKEFGAASRVDKGRIVVPASVLSGCGAGYLLWQLVPTAAIWVILLLGLSVCILVAWRLARRLEQRDWARWCAKQERLRAMRVSESKRLIAKMHAEAVE